MPLIVGTAGHIDHGKTSLVRALTGQDTDRLKEEQERGISIDLGFAWLDGPDGQRAGIVDVPGHERFVRNMLAGAHGMDLVLFTVAADDGVMPQTEEHLDILHLLGVQRGIFVITKIDLVDAARVAVVREEVEILALDTGLEGAPIVPVSTLDGTGLDALRGEIAAQLARPREARREGYFRLPVDRAFVVRGHGVVVTGTAVAGDVSAGDTVRVLPRGTTARVRGLEVHGAPAARAGQGQRVAMNLGGVDLDDVPRGDVVCDARIERATRRFDARVEVRPGARHALAHHGRVRVHAGTAEVLARAVLLGGDPELPPRGSGWAQLVLRDPIVALRGDRFIVRDETARWTLGGGIVVNPFAERHRRAEAGLVPTLERLHGGTDAAAAATFLEAAPDFAVGVGTLAQGLGVTIERAVEVLASVNDAIPVEDSFGGPGTAPIAPRIPPGKWKRFAEIVLQAVSAKHRADPLATGLEMESLRGRLPWDVTPRVFRWGIERLVAEGRLVRAERVVHLPSHRIALDAGARAHAARVERLLVDGGFTPPGLRQLGEDTGLPARELLEVLTVLEAEDRVMRIAPDLFYAKEHAAEALARLEAHCRSQGEITAAAFRDLIGASRKFAIAFLDWTDRTGVTLRIGDARRLRR
jgi:selenocysteine-specific elongation factor